MPKIAVPDSDYGLLEEEARAKTHEDIADYANSLISDLENTTCSFSERKSEIIHLIESLERYQTIIKKNNNIALSVGFKSEKEETVIKFKISHNIRGRNLHGIRQNFH